MPSTGGGGGGGGGVKRRKATVPPVSDFKRIKAKVGKKAPKPASYTDTSFRKASLHVANSTTPAAAAAAANEGDVRSSRGRSLTTIAQQLSHTTISIRQAAAKGLLDIVASSTNIRGWQAHLSTVLPALGQCLVDEDTTVRSTGLSVWQEIVERCTESLLRPFWEVFMAFVSSGLNSLDHRVRRDNRIIVASASQRLPTLVAPFVTQLLPALMRLLDDKTFQYHNQVSSLGGNVTTTTNKRNRNGRQVWLETLVVVLHTVQQLELDNTHRYPVSSSVQSLRSAKNEWTFTPGATSKNALFVASPGMSTIDLPSMKQWWLAESGLGEVDQGSVYRDKEDCLTTNVITEVWTKLRDLLLELLESNNNADTLLVWSKAVLALMRAKGGISETTDEAQRLILQVQGLVLKYEPSDSMMNLWMLTLTQLSQALPSSVDTQRRSSWIAKVVTYLREDNDAGTSLDTIRLEIFQRILDNPSVVGSTAGKKIVQSLIHNWEESTMGLSPRLYAAASVNDRQVLLRQMMNFCILAGNDKDERSVAGIFEFILDKTRDPEATPDDLLNRFMPIWEKDVVLHYSSQSTQRLAIALLLNLIAIQGMNTAILDALSRLCVGLCNKPASPETSSLLSLIQDAVFDLRKQLPLASFFGFLMDVTGAVNLGDNSLERDKYLQAAASYLVGSGVSNVKILKMLWPLWRTWLTSESSGVKRAALCFLAVLAVDEGSHTFLAQEQLLGDDATSVILKAVVCVLQRQERTPASFPWFQPISTLLRVETWIWQPLLYKVTEDLSKIEPVLLYNCRDVIREVIQPTRDNAALLDKLGESASELEDTAKEGPLRVASRDLTDGIRTLATLVPAEMHHAEEI